MNITRDMKDIIIRKLNIVKERKENVLNEKIRKSLVKYEKQFSDLRDKMEKLNKDANKEFKKMGVDYLNLGRNGKSYFNLGMNIGFDVNTKYLDIVESIECGENKDLKKILNDISKM